MRSMGIARIVSQNYIIFALRLAELFVALYYWKYELEYCLDYPIIDRF